MKIGTRLVFIKTIPKLKCKGVENIGSTTGTCNHHKQSVDNTRRVWTNYTRGGTSTPVLLRKKSNYLSHIHP